MGCTAPSPTPTAPVPSLGNTTLLQRLEGAWVERDPVNGHWFEEHWTMNSNGELDGIGLVRSGKDTVMIEYLSIRVTDTATWYSARIPSQNGGEPVYFRMGASNDSLSFHNPDHDHPQRITYVPVAEQGWRVRLTGTRKGTPVEETLLFERITSDNAQPL